MLKMTYPSGERKLHTWIRGLDIIKLVILPKSKIIAIKIPIIFVGLVKLIFKFMEEWSEPKRYNIFLSHNKMDKLAPSAVKL